jgi:hypothetical protein
MPKENPPMAGFLLGAGTENLYVATEVTEKNIL